MFRRISIGLSLLLLFGCEESFTPKAPFQRVPILYCILEADYRRLPDTQGAIVSSTYDVVGFDPRLNRNDPGISGAKVHLQVNERGYPLLESSIPRADTARYDTPQIVYLNANVLLYPFDTVSIRAVLPDGSILTAASSVPSPTGIETTPLVPPQGFTTKLDRFLHGSTFTVDWDDGVQEEHLFFPGLTIGYMVRTPLGDVSGGKRVPLRYVSTGGNPVPVFPSYQTDKACVFDFDAIDRTMREISEGDPHKENYLIGSMGFSLSEFDFPLSRYYASTNGYLDQYSVRIDESVFTNVRGGIGVFGVRMDSRWSFKLEKKYIESFGYRSLY